MPDFVITASIYVDDVPDEAAAIRAVERTNAGIDSRPDYVFIRLPDPPMHPNDSRWEEIEHSDESGE